jgi:integrase
MTRRAYSEGTVTRRADGRWMARLAYVGVQQHWRRATARHRRGSCTPRLCRKHLEPEPFGALALDRLRPSDIEAPILDMRAATKPGMRTDDDTEPEPVRAMSDSTIRSTYTVLRSALHGAVRDGLLARNPAALVKRPAVEHREARHLDADDVSALLTAAAGSRYHPALTLIAATGLRKGEALALRWDAVDLDAGTLAITATLARIDGELVVSQPKTARSRRIVPLRPGIVWLLKRHRTAQIEERLRAGNQWQDTGLVFTTELGTPVDPRNLLRVVETAAKSAGVDGIGVHTLRHSAAVAWLEHGVHIKALADLLGHSSISVTGDTYGHTSDGAARSPVDALGASTARAAPVIDVLLRAVAVGVGVRLGQRLVAPRRCTPSPGWYADPWRLHTWRWFDGAWTGWTYDALAGVTNGVNARPEGRVTSGPTLENGL